MTDLTDDLREEDLPILGEPLAVELANSLYESEEETIDFLSTSRRASLWFGAVKGPSGAQIPARFTKGELTKLGELRAVIRELLLAATQQAALPAKAVQALNRFAAVAPCYTQLVLAENGEVVTTTVASRADTDGLLSRLAHEAICLLSSRAIIRRCEAPGCPMFFVQNHHRRRWCHESCGHRSRQAAYYRRKHPKIKYL